MTQITGGGGSCSLRYYDAMHTEIDMWFTPINNVILSKYVQECLTSNANISLMLVNYALSNLDSKSAEILYF